jgi:hypothetical protein
MKLRWYRLLDTLQSFLNKKRKKIREKRKWGEEWKDKTRSGRRYTRVFWDDVDISADPTRGLGWKLRPEPGWEYSCPNCHEYSLVTESMMPAILEEWRATVARMAEKSQRLAVPMPRIPPEPTAATAGCTNCRYRPGAPE